MHATFPCPFSGYSGGHLVIWSRGGDGITVARNGRRIEEKCEPCACDFYLPKKDGDCVFHSVTGSRTFGRAGRPCRRSCRGCMSGAAGRAALGELQRHQISTRAS